MSSTRLLAESLVSATYNDLPESARHAARRCLFDAIACAAAGQTQKPVEIAHKYARSWFRTGTSSVWFRQDKLSPQGAAYVNSQASSILDMDDGHRAASGHPGAAVVPAVLATAQNDRATLQDVLLAIACGYEAGVTIARARDASRLKSVATGRWSAVAVAAAVAKLRKFDTERMAHAIAIAESHAPNLLAADHAGFAGSDTKEGIPWSVLAGLTAVRQAPLGLRGYLSALDNPDVYRPGHITGALGPAWLIESTYFKPYSCCRWTHSAVDAISELREEGLDPSRTSNVTVSTFKRALSLGNASAPTDLISAQFSLPFVVATTLVEGKTALQPLSPTTLGRTDIVQVAERITLELDDELDSCFPAQTPARVSVHAGGQYFEKEIRVPHGDPANPLTDEQLVQKAIRLCTGIRSPQEVSAVAEQIISPSDRHLTAPLDALPLLTGFLT